MPLPDSGHTESPLWWLPPWARSTSTIWKNREGILQAAGDAERSPDPAGAKSPTGRASTPGGLSPQKVEAASKKPMCSFSVTSDHGSVSTSARPASMTGSLSVMTAHTCLLRENVAVTRCVVESTPRALGCSMKPNSDGSSGSREPFRPANPFIPIPKRQAICSPCRMRFACHCHRDESRPCFSGRRGSIERFDAIAARCHGRAAGAARRVEVPQEAVAAVNAHRRECRGASGVPEDLLPRCRFRHLQDQY